MSSHTPLKQSRCNAEGLIRPRFSLPFLSPTRFLVPCHRSARASCRLPVPLRECRTPSPPLLQALTLTPTLSPTLTSTTTLIPQLDQGASPSHKQTILEPQAAVLEQCCSSASSRAAVAPGLGFLCQQRNTASAFRPPKLFTATFPSPRQVNFCAPCRPTRAWRTARERSLQHWSWGFFRPKISSIHGAKSIYSPYNRTLRVHCWAPCRPTRAWRAARGSFLQHWISETLTLLPACCLVV